MYERNQEILEQVELLDDLIYLLQIPICSDIHVERMRNALPELSKNLKNAISINIKNSMLN